MRALQLTMTSSTTEAVGSGYSLKYSFSKIRKFHRKTSVLEASGLRPVTLSKSDFNTGVSGEICEIFKNTFYYRNTSGTGGCF